MAKLIKTHNNIEFIKTEDNLELYYLRDENLTGTTINALARLGNFPVSTIRGAVKRLEDRGVISLKFVKVPTTQGAHMGAFILEHDIPEVLAELQKGRASKKTKAAAVDLMKKFIKRGERWQEMAKVNPAALAIESIRRITDPEEVKEVIRLAEAHFIAIRGYTAL